MRMRLNTFQGEYPRLYKTLLPEGAAQVALDTNHERGTIKALHDDLALHDAGATPPVDFYLHNGATWLTFDKNVDVVPGPVADDRLYITRENDVPIVKVMSDGGAEYPLALPTPPAPPITSIATDSGATQESEVLFVYTWVSSLDEESIPSPPSTPLAVPDGSTVEISLIDQPPSGSRINRVRIYRSQTTALGATEFFFVKELEAATNLYVNDLDTDPLQELLASANYDPPVDDLRGITGMQSGMIAAFAGKSLYFCEPYRPHAWPLSYELISENPIVGLAAFGSMLAVLTTGEPYVVQGTAPENLIMEKIEQSAPCVSKDGIVDLGYAAAYPSTDGLITLSQSGGAQNITRGLFERDQWREFRPETFSAGRRDGSYVFSFDPGDGGGRQTAMIALSADQPSYIRTSNGAEKLRFDVYTGNLHFIDGSAIIQEFASSQAGYIAADWQSSQFHLPTLTSFGVLLVEGDALDDPSSFEATVYRDGEMHTTVTRLNEPCRLKDGLGRRWSVRVKGKVEISRITLAGEIEEIWG
jgi:hypothetical protein